MMDIKKVVSRKDVIEKYTWNLKDLFETEEQYEQCFEETKELVSRFVADYKGKIHNAQTIVQALREYAIILGNLTILTSYAQLDVEADGFSIEKQKREMTCDQRFTEMMTRLSFLKGEILENDASILKEAQKDPFAKHTVEEYLRMKPHIRSKEVEEVLAKLESTFTSFYKIYNTAKIQDMVFDDFVAKGENHKLSYNIFENMTENEIDIEVRRNSYDRFHETLEKYKNVTAQTYLAHCQAEKNIADIRGYDSVIDYLLAKQNVSRELYDRQLDVIMKELSVHMRKYAEVLKKEHQLDKITIADMKLDVESDFSKELSVEEGAELVLDGLSVLGKEYQEMLQRAFRDRWIDFVNNTGKSTGAFCASPYGSHSYILISWTGKMNEAMVLAHELGHAGHFYFAQRNQNILDEDCSLYFVESPSTTNELIMSRYLLKQATSEREKRWIRGQIIARTYYHNFVTHFLEAYYQREVYRKIDRYEGLTADDLSKMYLETIKKFYGDSVEYTKGIELTWMRQPHYYMGLYPYTYSAGLTIGTQVSKRIIEQGEPAVCQWIDTLKLGGTKDVIALSKNAGVDITTDAPLRETIEYIGQLIDQL